MAFIKALPFTLAVCVALLVPQYVLWRLDEYWSDTPDDAFEVTLDECTCPMCWVITPGDDDDADDD